MAARDIPITIKRTLRQQSGFGCCVCGHPFIEFHHIVPFAISAVHHSDNMMVLCPIHHHQCTVGALSDAQQRAAKSSPHNLQQGIPQGQLHFDSQVLAIEAGSNTFFGAGFKFVVDGEPLLRLRSGSDGQLLISLSLYDQDDNLLLVLEDNEWITGDPFPWDFEYGYNTLLLRQASRKVAIEIDARSPIVRLKGEMWRSRQQLVLRSDTLLLNGVQNNLHIRGLGFIATHIELDTRNGTVSFVADKRIGGGMLGVHPHDLLARAAIHYYELIERANVQANERCPCGSGFDYGNCHGV